MMVGPVVTHSAVVSDVFMIGQAPGPHEGAAGKPFAWTAGKTLFKWYATIGLNEEEFRALTYMAAVCRCFPGKAIKGADRVPTPVEVNNCSSWMQREFDLLKPTLVIPVGKLAIEQVLGKCQLVDVIGQTFNKTIYGVNCDLIPLPHPSGASTWFKKEPGSTLLHEGLAQIHKHPSWQRLLAAKSSLALALVFVLLSLLSSAFWSAPPATAADRNSDRPESAGKIVVDNATARKLSFPQQSLGKLYTFDNSHNDYRFVGGKLLAERYGKFVGEARGNIAVPLRKGELLYLVASFEMTEKPELLYKVAPDAIDCLSFALGGIMVDMKKTIKPVSHLTGLRYLEFGVAEFDDKAVLPLKGMTNLEGLNMHLTGIRGLCLNDFIALKKLVNLDVSSNMLDAEAFKYIARMTRLKKLDLARTGITDDGIAEIAKLPDVRELVLTQNNISARGLAHLQKMKNLRNLSLTGCNLTTRDLLALKGTKLQSMLLPMNRYTEDDMNLLHRTFAGVKLSAKHDTVSNYHKTLFGPLH